MVRVEPAMNKLISLAAILAVGLGASPALAQSLQDRIANVRQQRAASRAAGQPTDEAEQRAAAKTNGALRSGVAGVEPPREMSAKEAVEWIANVSGLRIVVNWERLQESGIDPEQTVRLEGRGLTAAGAINMLVRQI